MNSQINRNMFHPAVFIFFFSVSVSQRKIFMSFLFSIYFRERFNVSWCQSMQNSYRGTSYTSHHIIYSSTSTIRISDTSNLFIKYILKTKIGFQLNSLQRVYSMLKRSLLLIAKQNSNVSCKKFHFLKSDTKKTAVRNSRRYWKGFLHKPNKTFPTRTHYPNNVIQQNMNGNGLTSEQNQISKVNYLLRLQIETLFYH